MYSTVQMNDHSWSSCRSLTVFHWMDISQCYGMLNRYWSGPLQSMSLKLGLESLGVPWNGTVKHSWYDIIFVICSDLLSIWYASQDLVEKLSRPLKVITGRYSRTKVKSDTVFNALDLSKHHVLEIGVIQSIEMLVVNGAGNVLLVVSSNLVSVLYNSLSFAFFSSLLQSKPHIHTTMLISVMIHLHPSIRSLIL